MVREEDREFVVVPVLVFADRLDTCPGDSHEARLRERLLLLFSLTVSFVAECDPQRHDHSSEGEESTEGLPDSRDPIGRIRGGKRGNDK